MLHSEVKKAYSFLDYIKGGTELACTISIDFTASNGNPRNTDSLHYISPPSHFPIFNQYETAIKSVGEVIEDYDTDKLFPVLGFGKVSFHPAHILNRGFSTSISNAPKV